MLKSGGSLVGSMYSCEWRHDYIDKRQYPCYYILEAKRLGRNEIGGMMNLNDYITNGQIATSLILIVVLLMYIASKKEIRVKK